VIALSLILELTAFSIVVASFSGAIDIRNTGSIVYGVPPLHIDGRHVKDSLNRTVVLRGANYARFIDTPYGDWLRPDGLINWGSWNINAATSNLDEMEKWGMNVVRTFATVEWWANNTGNHRQIIKAWASLAALRGIYVVYGFWRVTGSGTQSGLPYPPYCEANSYIKNETDFVNLWQGIANELKEFPGIIFELWNEPGGNETSWFNVVQQCITAIRSTGAINLIVVQWGTCIFVNMEGHGIAPDTVLGMEWVERHPLYDPAGNILYSTHIYRDNLQKTTSPTYTWAYSYDDLKLAFHYAKVDYVINNLSKPVWIGEVGPNQWNTNEIENEYSFYNNTLTIMNEWQIGYAAWWWWVTGNAWGHIEGGQTDYKPNRAGQILKYGINMSTVPP